MRALVLLAILLSAGKPASLPSRHAARREPGDTVVRVGLLQRLRAANAITVTGSHGATITLDGEVFEAPEAESLRLKPDNGGVALCTASGQRLGEGRVVRLMPAPGALLTAGAPGAQPSTYRGTLECRPAPAGKRSAAGLLLIDEVGLEEYLRGVVPAEMPSKAPAAALRAQAVAARTYLLRCLGKHAAEGYDVTDTTECQAYGGATAETASTDAAVADTRNLVVCRGGKLLLTDYYDDCGGITAPGDDADDYPPSVIDAPPEGGPDYCSRGAHHTWSLTLTGAELARLLAAPGARALGDIQGIYVTEQDGSGRARRIRAEGTLATRELAGSAFRAAVGYTRLRSTLFTVQAQADGTFQFTGRGNGHGHGMCQEGAIGLAARYDYREILAHYFPDSDIVTFDGESRIHGAR